MEKIIEWIKWVAESIDNEDLKKVIQNIAVLYEGYIELFGLARHIDQKTVDSAVSSFDTMIKDLAFLLFDNRMNQKMSEEKLYQNFSIYKLYTTAIEYVDKITQEFKLIKEIIEEITVSGIIREKQRRQIAMHIQQVDVLRSSLKEAFSQGKEESHNKLRRLERQASGWFWTATLYVGLIGIVIILAIVAAGFKTGQWSTSLYFAMGITVALVVLWIGYQWHRYRENVNWLNDVFEQVAGQEEICIQSREAEFSTRRETYELYFENTHKFMADFTGKIKKGHFNKTFNETLQKIIIISGPSVWDACPADVF